MSIRDHQILTMNTQTHQKGRSSAFIQDVTGVILAGGQSSRYGKNKALAEFNGQRLIDRVVSVMKTVFHHILIITNTPDIYAHLKLPMVSDLIKGLGPIGGLYTGLSTITDPAGFFVACDMPFLNDGLVRHICRIRDDFDAVIPRRDWKIEALHALYTKECLSGLTALIDDKEYQIKKLFQRIRVKYIEEHEIQAFDASCLSLININRPQEMALAKKLLQGDELMLEPSLRDLLG